MSSRAKQHSQNTHKTNMTCAACKLANCGDCVDVLLAAAGRRTICECTRKNHSGEPVLNQVADPFTGTVHAPDMSVTADGTVLPRYTGGE